MRSNIYYYHSPWNKKIEVISVDLDEEIWLINLYEYVKLKKKNLVINGKRFICFSLSLDVINSDLKSFLVYLNC